jgi:lipocalin
VHQQFYQTSEKKITFKNVSHIIFENPDISDEYFGKWMEIAQKVGHYWKGASNIKEGSNKTRNDLSVDSPMDNKPRERAEKGIDQEKSKTTIAKER